MSEGTSLDDIESGTVQFEADQAAMHAIMADMNATEPDMPSMPSMPPMPSMPSMPPMMPPMPPMMPPPQMQQYREEQFTAQYEPVQEKQKQVQESVHPTKNIWSQLFDQSRDALIVGVLVCFFTLPALHTLIAKRLPWAYKVGGSMSWIGFLLLFIVSSASYMGYQTIVKKFAL
jgi:hypothetical protein